MPIRDRPDARGGEYHNDARGGEYHNDARGGEYHNDARGGEYHNDARGGEYHNDARGGERQPDARGGERQLDDALDIERRLDSYFAADADDRLTILRSLFAEVLGFDLAYGQVELIRARQRSDLTLPDDAHRIASLDGVHICHIDLSQTDADTDPVRKNDRVRKNDVLAAIADIRQNLGDDLLLLVRNRDGDQLHWIHPSLQPGPDPTLRRIVVERDARQRTVVQQLSNIWWEYREHRDIRAALDRVFDVEPVTKQFFATYKRIFDDAEDRIDGFAGDETEPRRQFVQTLFNRLMFVYFLSRKRWLRLNGETDYLNALWDAYKQHPTHANFYDDVLTFLFFEGLNTPASRDLRRGVDFIIGDVPFLNGGLFEQTDLDQRDGIIVPDEAIEPLLTDLFDRFNFTVMESTPFDIEVAVDPEMLGKVFEELVTGRHASGAYYTPRPVVAFMCREALKGYLETRVPQLDPQTIAAFVDQRQTDAIDQVNAPRLATALADVTVVDPACGSGAYLVGMMQELVELQTALFNVGVDDQSLYDLKLHIIERNLYGADIDPFAVNIAMLRLWLSLAIEYEDDQPEPLPNLDFKIVQGDSLLGPDPSQSQISIEREIIRKHNLAGLKGEYLRAPTSDEKRLLRQRIQTAEDNIRAALADANIHEDAVDWGVQFAEVIAAGGFDIAIANPPYLQLQSNAGRLGKRYQSRGYETFARSGDIYQLFYERGCQLLRREGGLLAYITSNSWLRANYGKKLRALFAERHTPLRWLDLGKDIFDAAIVDSGILLLRTGGQAVPLPAVDMDDLPGVAFPPSDDHWRQARPDGDAAWSILSHIEWSAIDKMRARGTPLKEWDVTIRRGVTTGLNEAFIIDTATRDALIKQDAKSAEIIKPILRGRDIQRWRAEWAGLWLISTFPPLGLDIDIYPAVKEHLMAFGIDRLKQSGEILEHGRRSRKKTNHAWFELQDTVDYYKEFAKEKLFWMDMSPEGRFAYSENMLFCNDKAYVLTGGSLKFLCAVLNSKLVTWFVQPFALTTGMGVLQWKKFSVQAIPVPKVETADQAVFIALVDRILDAKYRNPNADTSALERQIDRLVYDLYGLATDEIAAVESRLSR